jgi:quinol monooxygenase YgiN
MFFAHFVFDALPGKRQAAIEAMREAMAHTRAEPGCILYTFSADLDDPDRFHLAEVFASREAFEDHVDQPYSAPFVDLMEEYVRPAFMHAVTGEVGEAPFRRAGTPRTAPA